MSTAFYPLGMTSYGNRGLQSGYKSWKGKGIFSNPVGITRGNMRPLTNRDPLNSALYAPGKARPIKHYRKGISIPIYVPEFTGDFESQKYAEGVDYYYSNREVKSSNGSSLGGGGGGSGMISQMQDQPGGFIIKDNTLLNNGVDGLDKDCRTCKGVGIVSSWYPINNLSDKPEPNVTNPLLCCNQEYKARRRVLPASTLTNRSYYSTNKQYLYNRCKTYTQKSFAYLSGDRDLSPQIELAKNYPFLSNYIVKTGKPGSPLTYLNDYQGNCNCNFQIEQAASLTLFTLFLNALENKGILSKQIVNENNFSTIRELINYLKTLDQDTQQKSELLLLGLININSSSNNGSFISGPSDNVRRGCSIVYYKPNNSQFAKEGGVDSSTATLKTKVRTIELSAARFYGSRFTDLYKQKVPRVKFSRF
jgi:hypothetical protein